MKIKISILGLLISCMLRAQFNNTYDINGNSDYLLPSFVIPTSDMGCISVSYGIDAPAAPRNDYFILTKLNATGNVVFNKRFETVSTPTDGLIYTSALYETPDLGILVAGYYYVTNVGAKPFLMKVDANGNHLWTRIYNVESSPRFNKISICRVENDVTESYFIVSSSVPDVGSSTGVTVNVIKVDANGSMLISRKYHDTNSYGYTEIRDYPGDIAFSPQSGIYMITGWRQQWGLVQEDRMFFFGIDQNANIVTTYKFVEVPGYPHNQDMIYDPNTQQWAIAYTHGNTGFSGDPVVASGIGLIAIDASLNVILNKFYWEPKVTENYGMSISLCPNGDYVIGNHHATNPPAIVASYPSLLKVDNTGAPIWFKTYNVKDLNFTSGHHCMIYDSSSGVLEEYVIITQNSTDLRAIRTDFNGDACGQITSTLGVLDVKPIETTTDYYQLDQLGDMLYVPASFSILPPFRRCTAASYDAYREGQVTGLNTGSPEESGLTIYPTSISLSEPVFSITNESEELFSLLVTDISGKVILTSYTIEKGENKINLNGITLTPGIYFLKISGVNKETENRKIIISE